MLVLLLGENYGLYLTSISLSLAKLSLFFSLGPWKQHIKEEIMIQQLCGEIRNYNAISHPKNMQVVLHSSLNQSLKIKTNVLRFFMIT